ncbi:MULTISPECIES: acyl-CoA dehydrogenase family protein [Kitasatospora]|uniref:Putative isobutylamine N-hydroxylase n=1 Tax=Kitasatospora setae (strain ATCC 33774 / DSM 43861 / JCM 3304 / KCC A-0304 / NBRC 14216 / KM-6054) TaxID=452652 RepID=E4N6B0_KITSK|nr:MULTISPECIES: acyl-CoA dehydrogenase family protein [Kitasatospora]BAJ26741.1 putative isobutylamine N-hydroxylase [Kitasatospora setae KM-6054]
MRSLDIARDSCERLHPGMIKSFLEVPLMEREAKGSSVVEVFRRHGGPGLLVPAAYGGLGASALDAVRVTRAIGAHSPSLAAASAMHNFTAALLFALAERVVPPGPEQARILARIAPEGMLLASGWAEGRTQQDILDPVMTAEPTERGFLVNGSKKPCSLARSMDLLTASTILPDDDGGTSLVLLLIPADSPGISVHPFWDSPVLAAAQSDEVRLENVHVPERLVVRGTADDPDRLDDIQSGTFVWFELLVTCAYVGAASALTEMVLQRGRGSTTDRAALAVLTESAVLLTEGTARAVDAGLAGEDAVAAALTTRFAVQRALAGIADQAAELLGGIAFIREPEIAYLCSALQPLAFHPPGRTSSSRHLIDYYNGGALRI